MLNKQPRCHRKISHQKMLICIFFSMVCGTLTKIDHMMDHKASHNTFFFFFWLCWVFLAVLMGFSLVAVSRGYSLLVVHRHLIAVASLVAAPRLWSTGSVVMARRLSCSATCGIFPDQGSYLCLLHWQADSLPLSHQGSPTTHFK